MFIRNCWYVAGYTSELPAGEMLAIKIIDEPVLVYRTDEGKLIALLDRCCHRFAPLSKGRIEDGCNVRCLYHGFKFDSAGNCIEIPGQDIIPPAARVQSFPVMERGGWIWVWMGEPSAADPDIVPPALGNGDEGYVMKHGSIDYLANYQLINDNLTDFTHVSYVHANSFGATEAWAATRPSVKVLDRGIRVARWMTPEAGPLKDDAPGAEHFASGDMKLAMFQSYDFLAPGVLLMYTAMHDPRDVPADGTSRPQVPPISAHFSSQAVTPMGERETRYFFTWGPRSCDGGKAMAQTMIDVALKAFAEDRDIIEAQQRNMDLKPGREVLTSGDVGPVQMRSVIRRLLNAERTPADEIGTNTLSVAAQ